MNYPTCVLGFEVLSFIWVYILTYWVSSLFYCCSSSVLSITRLQCPWDWLLYIWFHEHSKLVCDIGWHFNSIYFSQEILWFFWIFFKGCSNTVVSGIKNALFLEITPGVYGILQGTNLISVSGVKLSTGCPDPKMVIFPTLCKFSFNHHNRHRIQSSIPSYFKGLICGRIVCILSIVF